MTDKELVESLCDIEDGMSEWEVEFVDSIDKQFRQRGTLTLGQRKKARRSLTSTPDGDELTEDDIEYWKREARIWWEKARDWRIAARAASRELAEGDGGQ